MYSVCARHFVHMWCWLREFPVELSVVVATANTTLSILASGRDVASWFCIRQICPYFISCHLTVFLSNQEIFIHVQNQCAKHLTEHSRDWSSPAFDTPTLITLSVISATSWKLLHGSSLRTRVVCLGNYLIPRSGYIIPGAQRIW